jgi:hypothetical protein
MIAPEAMADWPPTATQDVGPQLSAEAFSYLQELASTYVWWKTPEEAMRFPSRVAAQVMNLGTWEDLNRLAETAGEDYLRRILQHAEAGQLDARSWNYWHYRLGLAEYGKQPVPPMPVRKTG